MVLKYQLAFISHNLCNNDMNWPLYHKTYMLVSYTEFPSNINYYSYIWTCLYITKPIYMLLPHIKLPLNFISPLYHKTYTLQPSHISLWTWSINWPLSHKTYMLVSYTGFSSNINYSPYIWTCLYITKPIDYSHI